MTMHSFEPLLPVQLIYLQCTLSFGIQKLYFVISATSKHRATLVYKTSTFQILIGMSFKRLPAHSKKFVQFRKLYKTICKFRRV